MTDTADNRSSAESAELRLGDIVRVNDSCPFSGDWQNVTVKVVSLRIDPQGKQWVSVIEGEPRHRGNGVYDSEATDFDADYLTLVTPRTFNVAQSSQVPDGWKLVPLIPPPEMIEVGCDNNATQWSEGTDRGFPATVANDVYVSMVRAAPQPPAAPVETKPDWCQGADGVCHWPECACVCEIETTEESLRPRKAVEPVEAASRPAPHNGSSAGTGDARGLLSLSDRIEKRRRVGMNEAERAMIVEALRHMAGEPQAALKSPAVLLHTLSDIAAKRHDVNADLDEVCTMAESAIKIYSAAGEPQELPDRASIIEECAKVLDEAAKDWRRIRDPGMANNAVAYAKRIRSLALSRPESK